MLPDTMQCKTQLYNLDHWNLQCELFNLISLNCKATFPQKITRVKYKYFQVLTRLRKANTEILRKTIPCP